MPTRISAANIQPGSITADRLAEGVGVGGGPKITNVQVTDSGYNVLDDTAVSLSGGYLRITGTGFQTGCVAIVGNTPATATSFVSSSFLDVQVGAADAGTYILYVVNTDGGTAIRVNALTYSSTPTWITGSTLPSQTANAAISIQLEATSDSAVTYALAAGSSLPANVSLSSAGLISGTSSVDEITVFSFTIVATDAESQSSPRNFDLTVVVSLSVEYLVVAGGGGGSNGSLGGGGAGGFRTGTAMELSSSINYTVTVGSGGGTNANGSNSVFSTITSAGGGGGAGGGGSGGGGSWESPFTGGAGNTPSTAPSQGNNGGNGRAGFGGAGSNNPFVGGGGGGASAVGGNGISTKGGDGGAGTASSISGVSVTYAGGGGAGADNFRRANSNGVGGAGGGGDGGNNGLGNSGSPAANGENGDANTGGGGGGGSNLGSGAAGGSGVVILKYSDSLTISNPGGGLTYSTATAGGFSVTTFTAGTGNVQWS
jgi:hypothetical protein